MRSSSVAFLLDVDNTLLDSDRVISDLRAQLETGFGNESGKRYWKIAESLEAELGYADYLGALQRYRCEHPTDPHFFKLSLFLLHYPYSERLFDKALDVIDYLSRRGQVALVTNGDVVFQPQKIEQAGLYAAVRKQVLICIHKEKNWEDVEEHFPAQHYFVIDDEPKVLATAKRFWKGRATTIFVDQGKHAKQQHNELVQTPPDMKIDAIARILDARFRKMFERT